MYTSSIFFLEARSVLVAIVLSRRLSRVDKCNAEWI